jgi:DNA-binding winged helix-turn-helix (wHTH) protein/Tol biopolymer transport system component
MRLLMLCTLLNTQDMKPSTETNRLRFGPFELDLGAARLLEAGRPIKIQPQPLRVLALLAQRSGEIVSREELARHVWDQATFVEFDQGLNYCVRQIRLVLRDDAAKPRYLETVKKQGYRFVADVIVEAPPAETGAAETIAAALSAPPALTPQDTPARRPTWRQTVMPIAAAAVLAAVGVGWIYEGAAKTRRTSAPPSALAPALQPITEFADSALAPALSPDGRMLAFIRGDRDFLTPDQIYVKALPDGEARRLTNDPRLKYGPTFSPDGSLVAYTVMEGMGWSTYTVPVAGGDPRLVFANAAGLTWLDHRQLLFAEVRGGQHMGIVTAPDTRAAPRDVYFPMHERAMAHYAFASPDRRSALIVEMNDTGGWAPCRVVSLDGGSASHQVGPPIGCVYAGWSPDGQWMYFDGAEDGRAHLWRQRVDEEVARPLTSGATDERGIAIDPDGRSLLTSVGDYETTLWMHDASGDRQVTSEGQVDSAMFSADGQFVYYLLRRDATAIHRELRRLALKTDRRDLILPGVPVLEFDVAPDGVRLVYTTETSGSTQMWLATTDGKTVPRPIGATGERSPFFGPDGEIMARVSDGRFNYLERISERGPDRTKVVPYPISELQSVSPGRNWAMVIAPLLDNSTVAPMAVPLRGGEPVRLCEIYCRAAWSGNGRFVYVSVEESSLEKPGRTLAIPVGAHEALPALPPHGIKPLSEAAVIPGARSIARAALIPGPDPDTFAYVRTRIHRNLFRVTLPD